MQVFTFQIRKYNSVKNLESPEVFSSCDFCEMRYGLMWLLIGQISLLLTK